jgi:DNA-binding MarR family transcriptional regulator
VDELEEAAAMARTVKHARGALIDAVLAALQAEDGFLRAAHTQVFENLDPDGTRLTTLAERAQMSHQAMGEMVDELVRHGYLERLPDPADRRARLIRPSARGRAVLGQAAGQLCLLRQRWEGELTGVSVAQVVQALDALIRICTEAAAPRPR